MNEWSGNIQGLSPQPLLGQFGGVIEGELCFLILIPTMARQSPGAKVDGRSYCEKMHHSLISKSSIPWLYKKEFGYIHVQISKMMEYLPAESLLMVLPDRLRVNVISFGPFTDSPSVSPSRFSWNSCISFLGKNCINHFF